MNKTLRGLDVVGGAVMWLLFTVGPVHADPYKWCAVYSGNGGQNCGFVTIEQCRATVSGVGGFCSPNQFYTGPEKARSERRSRAKSIEKREPRPSPPKQRPPADRFSRYGPVNQVVEI